MAALLIISDSHGNLPALGAALRWAARQGTALTAAVFLGDGSDDVDTVSAQEGLNLPWYRVRGNGDLDFSIPGSLVAEIPVRPRTAAAAVRRLFLAHGNRFAVEAGTKTIAAAARANGAEAALFGHTHIPFWGSEDGVALLNPGSIGRPRSRTGPTFAVLDCLEESSGDLFSVRFFGLAGRKGTDFPVRQLSPVF